MSLPMPQPELLDAPTGAIDPEAWTHLMKRLSDLSATDDQSERRRDDRYAFPCLMYLTPVGEDGRTPNGEPIIAAGKDLSEGGLGFYHPEPLPSQRMIASLQTTSGHWLAFVVELTRSHSISQGWYQSSGRFVEPVVSPMESA
jgi:hypothetical protein